MAYETTCAVCDETLTNCTCPEGPTIPEQNKHQCTVCGSDPNAPIYRKALQQINDSLYRKQMREIAQAALDYPNSTP